MDPDPPETAELVAFVRILDAGSLSAASRALGQPRATLSRRLARLEERLGVRLLRRTSRRLSPTDAGETLYRHARPIVEALRTADLAVRRTDERPRGLLRVSVPPAGREGFSDLFVGFLEAYPLVQLEIVATNRPVDLVAGEADVAVRAGRVIDPGLIARILHTTPLVLVASPGYLAAAGTPLHPDELVHHACLTGLFTRGELPMTVWPLYDGGAIRVPARLASNELDLVLEAAIAGLGLTLAPWIRVMDEVEAGKLVIVLEGVVGAMATTAVVYPEREYLPPAVRAFVDHAARWSEARFAARLPHAARAPV